MSRASPSPGWWGTWPKISTAGINAAHTACQTSPQKLWKSSMTPNNRSYDEVYNCTAPNFLRQPLTSNCRRVIVTRLQTACHVCLCTLRSANASTRLWKKITQNFSSSARRQPVPQATVSPVGWASSPLPLPFAFFFALGLPFGSPSWGLGSLESFALPV